MDRYPSSVVGSSNVSTSALVDEQGSTQHVPAARRDAAFSAAMAGVSMALKLPPFGLFTILIYFGLLFAVTKTQNSSWGILWTFALTGFLGLTLGPILNLYLTMLPNGSQIVMTALGTTAVAFLGCLRTR